MRAKELHRIPQSIAIARQYTEGLKEILNPLFLSSYHKEEKALLLGMIALFISSLLQWPIPDESCRTFNLLSLPRGKVKQGSHLSLINLSPRP